MVRAKRKSWSATARALMKRSLQTAVLVAVAASVPAAWSAGPKIGNVAAASSVNLHVNNVPVGSAAFSNSGTVTTVRTGSARTVINYQYLSVPVGTTLQFTQPSANSRVLNRIQGEVPTAIDGTLKSNGILYLVSPAGIIFGNGAVIQVGKFFAAAAHMSDGDFVAGQNHFTDAGGTVANYGTITANQVHLVGSQVANFGQIVAGEGGVVTMTAGKDVYIGLTDSPTSSPRVMVKVSNDTGTQTAGTGVTNGGTITAGQIRLGAGDMYAAGIYNNGTIKGNGITIDSGASTNITRGTVDATSDTGKGGTIELLGAKVGVFGGTVDASGKTGGGKILVGGDLHGAGNIPVSENVMIGSSAVMRADATSTGNGGEIIAFSSVRTDVNGQLSALGAGGRGGFVETSSHNVLSVLVTPLTGANGQWLLDPASVTIGGASTNESNATANGTTTFTPTADGAVIPSTVIETALSLGTSVTVNTLGSTTGDIQWISGHDILPVTTTGTAPTLTLNAKGDLEIDSSITTTGTSGIDIALNSTTGNVTISGSIITHGGNFATAAGAFTLTTGNSISTGGGNVFLKNTGVVTINGAILAGAGTLWSTGTDFTNAAPISSATAINLLHTGNVTLAGNANVSTTGTLSIAGVTVNQTAGTIIAGTVAIRTSGNDGAGTPHSVTLDQASNVFTTFDFAATTGTVGAVDIQTTTSLNFATAGALTGVPAGFPAFAATSGVTNANASVTIQAGGAVNISNAITAGTSDVSLTTTTGDINGVGAMTITGQNIVLNAAGGIGGTSPVLLAPAGNVLITTGGADAAGNATIDFTGAIATSKITTLTNTGATHANQTFSFLANGNFTIDSAFGASAQNMSIASSGGGILSSGGTVTGNVLTFGATGSPIGTLANPISFVDGTSATFNSASDVFVTSATYNKPLTFVTDATPRTVAVVDGGTTISSTISAGANNTLIVSNTGGVTLSSTGTLTGKTVYVTSPANVTISGNITAGTSALLLGNTVTGAGVISATNVGVEATGILAGASIALGNVSATTIAATNPLLLGGTVSITTTGDTTIGSVGAFSPAGFTPFAAVSGVSGNGNDVSVVAGGNLTVNSNVTAGLGGNVTLNANGANSTLGYTSGTISGDNISLLATGGIGSSGAPVQVSTTGAIDMTSNGTAHAGDIFVQVNNVFATTGVTITTNNTSGQTVSLASTGALTVDNAFASGSGAGTDDVVLSGTTLTVSTGNSVSGGNVTLTSTAGALTLHGDVTAGTGDTAILTSTGGGITQTAGTITAPKLAVNSAGAINITSDAVGIFAAVSNGTLTFTNAGGFTIGQAGALTGVSSNGNTITLRDTTGAIAVNQNVNAGGGTASIRAGTGLTGVSGSNGTVTGSTVTLTADSGDIGVSGTQLKTNSSTQLNLTGTNVFVKEAGAINTTASTRLNLTAGAGATVDLTASSFNVTTSFAGTGPLFLSTTSGAITTSGAGTLTGSSITLNSAAGIGTAGTPLSITPGAAAPLSFTATSAGIFITSATAIDLGVVTISDSAGQTVALTAPTMTTTAAFTAGSANLTLTTSTAGSGLTLTNSITAGNITVITDAIATGTGAFLTGTGTVTVKPLTSGRGILLSTATDGTVLTLTQQTLTNSTANTFTIGDAAQNDTFTIDTVNLSTTTYGLNFHTAGQYDFIGSLTLPNDRTLVLDGASSIVNTASGTALTIGGTLGRLTITNIGGDIGSVGSPLTTAIEQLGVVTGTGHLFIVNTGALNVSSSITLTAGGVGTGNLIAAQSPLTVSATVSVVGNLTLSAGNTAGVAGDDLTVTADVHASGNIGMTAGDGIVLTGGNISAGGGLITLTANNENSLADTGLGSIAQSGAAGLQASTVTASATTGITLDGSNNQIGTFFAQNLTGADTATGSVHLTNTGASGLALTLGTITNNAAGGAIQIVTTGAVTQSGSIAASNADLTVRTLNNSGAAITLTNGSNDLGTGKATLQVRDASNGTSVSANVAYTTAGQLHLQQIQSGATVTLNGTTIDQVTADGVGIQASTLNVTSSGTTTLIDANNNFSTLNVTDGSSGGVLQYETNASGGLTITGFAQPAGGTATITNTSGAVTSSAALTQQFLTVNAAGGISLSSNTNLFQSVAANNTTSGNIDIHAGNILPLLVTSLSETGGGNTSLTSTNGIGLQGTIAAGSGLSVLVNVAGGTYATTSAAAITSTGPVVIIADHMAIDSASSLTATGQQVTLKPLTLTETISINGADGAGTLGLLNAELATISAARLTLGAFVAPADPANQTGAINATGTFNLPTNVRLVTTGNVALAPATITTTNVGAQQLEVDHDGTLSISTATIDGGLLEFAANGSGAGGLVSLSGTLTTPDHVVNFLSPVTLTADTAINTVGSTGANITFGNASNSVNGTHNLTLTAGTGNIVFSSAAGGSGSPLSQLQVVSANNVTFQAVNAAGENINNTGVLTINGTQTLGASGFTQSNATNVALNADIVTASGTITLNSLTTLSGATRTLDTTNAGASSGANIGLNGVVSGGSTNLTLTAGTGNVEISAPITTLGVFTSTGTDFTNGNATNHSAIISAGGIRILHNVLTGDVTIFSNLNSPGFNVITQGRNVTLEQGATITGDQVSQPAGVGVFVNDAIFAPSGYTSSGSTPYTITSTGSITTNGANATINYPLGLVTIDGPINASGGTLVIDGLGIQSGTTGTIIAGIVTLNGHGQDVTIGGTVTGSGLFSSTGASFTNTAGITGLGITLNHTGLVSIQAALDGSGNAVSITGLGITSNTSGTINGSNVTLTGGLGNVSVGGTIVATGLFSTTGANFINTAGITGVGVTVNEPTGSVNFDAPIQAGIGDVFVTAATIASNANGTIGGANITLDSAGDVTLVANVTGTGEFISNGTTFTGGNVSAANITLNHTGLVTLNGNLTASSGTGLVSLGGAGVTQAGGIVNAGALVLTGTGTFTLTDANTVGILAANITGPLTYVNASNLIVGSAGSAVVNGITTNNGLLSLTINSGNLTVSQPIATGSGAITFLASAGDIVVNSTVTTTSTFTSNGTAFTNTGTITANGITLNHTGAVNIDGPLAGGSSPINITGVGIASDANGIMVGGTITLTAGTGDVALNGVITGSGLFTSTGVAFTNTASITSAGANLTHTGAVNIDGALMDGSSPVNIIGVGIASNGNGTMTAGNITLVGGSGNVLLAGTITATGLFHSTGANFTNTANITSAGANITHLGPVNIDGALIDGGNAIVIDAPGISSDANGTMQAGPITLTAGAGDISIAGTITATGLFTSTGAAFINTAGITSAGANITQTGAINIDGPLADGNNAVNINGAGITSNTNGTITGGTITLTGNSGNVILAGNVNGSGLFTSTGAAFTNTGSITSNGANITHSGAVNIDGAIVDGAAPVNINGLGITSNSSGTINAGAITLTANSGDVSLAGTIVGSGVFTSTGVNFINTASITSAGANITHTGLVQLQGAIIDTGNPVNITGVGITSNTNGTIAGSTITLVGGSGNVILAGNVLGSGLFHSTGAGFLNTGSITSVGANITHTGAVNIDGALADGSSAVIITGAGITSNTSGTITGGTITLTGGSGGAVTLAGVINGSGLFTSTGAAFTNTASITSAGANLTHTGAVNIDGALIDGTNTINIIGNGIASNTSGTITAGPINLTAGSGDVSLAGVVAGSGFFHSTGAGFLNTGSITVAGANLTHTGLVQINAALVSTGNPVTITGVGINSNVAGTIAASTITLNALSGNTHLDGAVIGSGLFTSTGVGFTNNGTLSAVGIRLTDTGAVVINNTMNANAGALSITNAGSIADASSTLSGVGVTLQAVGSIVVGNTINASTGAATLTSTSSSITDTGAIAAGSATLTAATNITAAAITTTAGNISLNAPSSITLLGNLNAGTFGVFIHGPAILGNNILITGGTVDFTSTIAGAGKSLTVNASGLTTFSGDIGSSGAPLLSLVTDAPGTTTLNGSIFTTAALAINDPLTLTANSVISGGTVSFGNTITGGGIASLAVSSTTSSLFAGAIGAGAGNALTTFQVSGATATFDGPSITTTGGEAFSAPVLLAGPLTLTGTTFAFTNTINSAATPEPLHIVANGAVSFGAVIGGTSPLGSLIVTGSTGTALTHAINTTGDISITGPITISTTLISSAGNIALAGKAVLAGATALTANGAGGITFGLPGITGNQNIVFTSNANGSKTSVGAFGTGTGGRVGNVTFNSAGVVALGGNIFANNLKFAYKNGGAAPTFNPTTATVFYAKGDLIINTSGSFDMEQNQSLAVFAAPTAFQGVFGTPTGNGNLSIVSNNHPTTIGDISAQGSILIDAGPVSQTISIRTRPSVQVTQAGGGTLSSPAVGITSGLTSPNAITLRGTLVVIPSTGSTNQVFFSSGAATIDIANKIDLQLGDVTKILDFNRTDALTGAKFLNGSTSPVVLNQVPTGIGLPPQNQVNVIPRDIQTLEPERAAAISGALKDALRELGIYARDLRTDELIEYLVGTALYDDVPYKLNPSPQDTQVAANRLPYAPVLPTVDAYRRLFLKTELDANGNPVLDDKGKPKTVVQNTVILNTFGQTWLAYKNMMKDKATPEGFRAWLEANAQANPRNAAALSYLDQLRDLLNQIHSLGLTATEYDVSMKVLLSKVRPPNIKDADFITAIMGPSTRAKNMTAMR